MHHQHCRASTPNFPLPMVIRVSQESVGPSKDSGIALDEGSNNNASWFDTDTGQEESDIKEGVLCFLRCVT